MDDRFRRTLIRLFPRQLIRVRNGVGKGVVVLVGSVWVTQEGDQRDVVLRAGESFHFDRTGTAIVEALHTSAVLLLFTPASLRPARTRGAGSPAAHV